MMSANDNVQKYLPLTESTYYILLALLEPAHGYAIMQNVEQMSEGTASIGPGTLYGAFSTLEKEGLIAKHHEEERRKYYMLTEKGRKVLAAQIRRVEIMARIGSVAALQLQPEQRA
jgi:DNA-binding PadR family transcriptional regulator